MPAIDRGFDGMWKCLRGACLLWAVTWLSPHPARAFPPAPFHTLYGTARNEIGQLLEGGDIKVILETPSGRFLHSGVGWVSIAGANYVLRVPMDSGLFDAPYHPTAMRPAAPFRLKVVLGRTVLLPIEMQGDLRQLGKPGGRTRIDLTLGEDADADGLPDAWERILMALLGQDSLEDFRPGDDADGDGLTNQQEYLAGSYAFDPADGFRLDIVEKRPEGPVMEFLALRGRTYSVQSSADLRDWAAQSFTVDGAEGVLTTYRAADTRVVRIVGLSGQAAGGFFRLMVE